MNGWKIPLLWTGVAILVLMLAQFEKIVLWTDLHSGFASWVQAVGSVLAILAAAVIAGWQTRRAEHAEREKRRIDQVSKYLALLGVVLHANVCFKIGKRKLEEKAPSTAWKQLSKEVAQVRSILASLPILELPGPYTAPRISLIEQNLRTLASFCDGIVANNLLEVSPEVIEIFEKMHLKSAKTVKWIQGEIESGSTLEEMREITRETLYPEK